MMTPNPYVSTKNPSKRKSLHQFTEILDAKHKTYVCRFEAARQSVRQYKNSICCGKNLLTALVIPKKN